jgi:ATP-dependent helicase/nuclease subunit A
MNNKSDQAIRQQALNTQQSYIVQAPAGSGKTELLTQRYLALLAQAERAPEEIIAITFTRKATAEMRDRVMGALALAKHSEPEQPHKKITWQLAKNALKRDTELHWNLLENPNRLRIMTLDGLASFLCRQLPLLSQSVAQLNISDDSTELYECAINDFIDYCISNRELKGYLETVLLHLDNRPAQLRQLLTQLLSKREQWLPHILPYNNNHPALKAYLEAALLHINKESLSSLNECLSSDLKAHLHHCVTDAATILAQTHPEHPICQILKFSAPPDSNSASAPCWQAIAHCLIKSDGQWRKTVDKRLGFEAKSELKKQFVALINSIANDALLSSFNQLLRCPEPTLDPTQWRLLDALLALLPLLAAQCTVTFKQYQAVDFVALNMSAQTALGSSEQPTDLALYMDYKTRHFLIDEFQDTSISQYRLIETLIAGWQPDDGRTLFIVGDPMQSIYRFREADVSLFLRVQQNGIAEVTLTALTLKQNFRSDATIVDWINQCFSKLFPAQADINTAAIPHSEAFSTQNNNDCGVQFHCLTDSDTTHQAHYIANRIQQLQSNNASASIAVLVRSRSHLIAISDTLREKSIPFEAVDITPLHQCNEILELLTLTRALLHREDSIAWLALLRAPYCGLTLNDIYIIRSHSYKHTLWHNLQHIMDHPDLSSDAKQRLLNLIQWLQQAFATYGQLPLHRWLRNIWLNLNIPNNYQPTQHNNCELYFTLIMQLQSQPGVVTIKKIHQRLQRHYSNLTHQAAPPVKLMTIHKSKGLEFDHVILPELDRRTLGDQTQLMLWQQRLLSNGQRDLLIAPMKHVSQQQDPVYQYLAATEKLKSHYESQRLLYVATTRAKKTLDLVLTLHESNKAKQPYKTPSQSSFAGMLWQHYQTQMLATTIEPTQLNSPEQQPKQTKIGLTRFKTIAPSVVDDQNDINTLNYDNDIHLANLDHAHIGTIIHETLEHLSSQPISMLQSFDVKAHKAAWLQKALTIGIDNANVDAALTTITTAIKQTLTSERGQWILSSEHREYHSEYPISIIEHGTIKHRIIDRWLIDKNETLWIIDYKTVLQKDQMEHYKKQLMQYANALSCQFPGYIIRQALYSPLTGEWIELENTHDTNGTKSHPGANSESHSNTTSKI